MTLEESIENLVLLRLQLLEEEDEFNEPYIEALTLALSLLTTKGVKC